MKKIAIINDMSGYGRCSLSVIMPIVSHLGIQACPLPTAIFSNHTGFKSFYKCDFTRHMSAFIEEWQKLELTFDGILTGFLGSAKQIQIVEDFIKWQREADTPMVIVDPVMGDNGKIYATYTPQMCRGMKKLIAYADIITPNLTEACYLTNTPYRASGWTDAEYQAMVDKLHKMGARKVVITGVLCDPKHIGNVISTEAGSTIQIVKQPMVKRPRSGTGDVFAGIIAGDAVKDIPFRDSVRRASLFVRHCLQETEYDEHGDNNTGIEFEGQLRKL